MSDHWWIVFEDVPRGSTPGAWVVQWLPRGLRHVWALREVVEGVWVSVNPHSTLFGVDVHVSESSVIDALVRSGRTLVKVQVTNDGRAWPRGWLTCVSVAKYLCGVRAWTVWTPPQLLAELERRGHPVIRSKEC